jgi:uncharacterized protein (DUF1800 family)
MTPNARIAAAALLASLLVSLASCGDNASNHGSAANSSVQASAASATVNTTTTAPTTSEAARFLTQATFGPSDADIDEVMASGYAAWINTQQQMTPTAPSRPYFEMREAQINVDPTKHAGVDQLAEGFWRQAATDRDQLRLRTTFALSQIFVISGQDGLVGYHTRAIPDYWDMLHANAFGNFRVLLEKVTLHPEMGLYLGVLGNDKGDPSTGRHPDENFAREVMQLMTIGLDKLNPDGTKQLDGSGVPIATYSHDDVAGLAAALTGYYFFSPAPREGAFNGFCFGCLPTDNFDIVPMIPYPGHHETGQKSFLGTTIPASASPDAAGDLKTVLDTLFNHPNVGPYIATRLIKQFVTSNPSPAYVQRVAATFNNNGFGVRGDLGATVRSILLDFEARDASKLLDPGFGKLREPVIRLANWMRAFEAKSQSQIANGPGGVGFLMFRTDTADSRLGQDFMEAPSVFNFWEAGFTPPNSLLSAQGLTGPEFQIVSEVSVAGYINAMHGVVTVGAGYVPAWGDPKASQNGDIHTDYLKEVAVAADATQLVARVNKLLTYGQMSLPMQLQLINAIDGIVVPSGADITKAQIDKALLNRSQLAVYMTLVSPEYLTQR